MRVGFDLDGVLDHPAMADLYNTLAEQGHDVYVITGVFPEADWQLAEEKWEKLDRNGLCKPTEFIILTAVGPEFPLEYRLRDLGLRKGNECEKHEIDIFFDDSELYCETIPKMCGRVKVVQVR